MLPQQALRWKSRFAFMYAIGTWTLLGGVAYYYYCCWGKTLLSPGEERTPPREKPADAFFTSTIVYKQNVQPTTALHEDLISFFTGSNGPGPEE